VNISSSPSGASGDVTLGSYDAAAHVYLERSVPPGPAVKAYLHAVAGLVGDGTVLEIGSGPGWDADYLESRGPRVLRTDGAAAFVQMLRAAGHQARLLDVRVDDLGGPYDAVLANAVLLHVSREQFVDVLQRARQAVASGGVLAITLKEGDGEAWTEAKLGRPRHFTYWREPAVRAVLTDTGWQVFSLENVAGRVEPWLFIIARTGQVPSKVHRRPV
jgi:protein-L-isoaspartate O-methyltransferase